MSASDDVVKTSTRSLCDNEFQGFFGTAPGVELVVAMLVPVAATRLSQTRSIRLQSRTNLSRGSLLFLSVQVFRLRSVHVESFDVDFAMKNAELQIPPERCLPERGWHEGRD